MTRNPMFYVLLLCALLYSTSAVSTHKPAEQCVTCHGKDGVSVIPTMPAIAGFSKTYLISALTAYKLGERASPMMSLVKNFKDHEIVTDAEFFANKTFVPRKQEFDAEKAKTGEKIHASECNKCHQDGGRVPEDDAGILGGQWMSYLRTVLKEYHAGKRPMPENMKAKIEKLDETDIEALVNYYGSLQ
ncbi:MAG: c-type cytochrome [Acidiferrobacterales bacterium]|nr:c-type cytochrome [Acidiferrobacterales bacterium]